jgi:hypothetical protein
MFAARRTLCFARPAVAPVSAAIVAMKSSTRVSRTSAVRISLARRSPGPNADKSGGRRLQDAHAATNPQNLGHLFGEVGIAPFQIISHFVRLYFFLIQNLANRACARLTRHACLPPIRARALTSQKPGRPQFVGVTEVLRPAARQRHEPSLGLERDPRFPARTRTIFERSHRTFHDGPLDAASDRLVVQRQRPADREK